MYPATLHCRLCLFGTWLEQPAAKVLQNRVVPRLLIDLMLADLKALGKLNLTLERLETTLHDVYNTIARPEEGAPLRRLYEELVAGWTEG